MTLKEQFTDSMKKLLFIAPVYLVILSFIALQIKANINPTQGEGQASVVINDKLIVVKKAETFEEQVQGLSGQKFLGANNGLLFIFKDKQVRSFWMKNMHFPIDIIWIDDNKVIKIDKRLEPEGEKPKTHYYSDQPVNYVLEVNGGFTDAFGIKVGDFVEYNY